MLHCPLLGHLTRRTSGHTKMPYYDTVELQLEQFTA